MLYEVITLTKLYEHITDVHELPELLKGQIKHFFERYKELEAGKWVKVEGWGDKAEAIAEIEASVARYQEANKYVITSYSIHYTKLYENTGVSPVQMAVARQRYCI